MGKLDSLEELFKSAPRDYYMDLPEKDIRGFLLRAASKRGFAGSQEYIEGLYDLWKVGLIEVNGDIVTPNSEAIRMREEYSLGREDMLSLKEEISREARRSHDEGIM